MPISKNRARGARTRRFTPGLETLERREVFSVTPYLLAVAPSVQITPIITVGDSVPEADAATDLFDNGATPQDGQYRMAGLPDGLGAFDNGDGTFTVLMNHEIASGGVVRDHGSNGGLVSKWIIRKSDLAVVSGDDLIKNMQLWNGTSYVSGTTVLNRLCSADLPEVSAFYNAATGKGTTTRIFMNGEETSGGRAFAHLASGPNAGTSYQLPALGARAHENVVANPKAQDTTVIIGTDDTTPTPTNNGGKVFVYVGTKTTAGTDIEKAGLTNGVNYAIQVAGVNFESRDFGLAASGPNVTATGTFSLIAPGSGGTQFLRPEDVAWDPRHPETAYFVTTDRLDQVADGVGTQVGRSRLWELRFTDISNPSLGGTITMRLDGTEGGNMFDNITVDKQGHVFLQEDPGNAGHLAKIWMYDIDTDQLLMVAKHNPSLFGEIGVPAVSPFNQDEESSGIIDVSAILGPGRYLVDVQAHYSIPGELVEGGQLLLINTNAPTATVASGVLTVGGTINDDQILVNRQGNSFQVVINSKVIATVPASGISQIVVAGESGDDVIVLAANITLPTIVHGGFGNDLIFGSNGANDLYGDEGNDILMGGNGVDRLHGGAGNDLLFGGNGNDFLFGDAGNDYLFGGNGADSLDGGDDEDWLFGENGLDLLANGEHDWQ